jgi:hypothetical protein
MTAAGSVVAFELASTRPGEHVPVAYYEPLCDKRSEVSEWAKS